MNLRAPLSEEEVRSLKLGDEVSVSGTVFIGRDEVHIRALEMHERKEPLPVDLNGGVLFHCGPIARQADGGWEIIAAGPTTSSRMNSLEPDFIEAFGIRAIIGKGGMSRPTVEAMKEHGCVYLAFPGGAAVLAAKGIREVKKVEWLDLGMPEALWVVEAEDLGPLTVAIDARGNSWYDRVDQEVQRNLSAARARLGL
ncbi:FumA C-terminus/TtdB family hydratase beta subunit [Methanomassiliicoccus luminyensis]|uniref:FumA C-terminus/TtdB family hydratase beta subunit n=1 Tax=Methanomassiliicoccus luminyensis TaxID=1080712 RepID=UPI00037E632D|nr:FumA C-terminus/TtdB family hydratase beta subunit [Methanomassiliicoccus luminyensis]